MTNRGSLKFSLIGVFAKLPKATISFVISVWLSNSAHGKNSAPTDFQLNLIFEYFLNIRWKKFRFHYNLTF